MSVRTLPVPSRTDLAREALADAKTIDLTDRLAVASSQGRLTATVEMLLHLLGERAA